MELPGRNSSEEGVDDKALIISSDGHASAEMPDYREYMSSRHHEEFDAFCRVYEEKGSRNYEPKYLLSRTDPEVVDSWVRNVLDPGRVHGVSDPFRRFEEMDRQGVVGEVLFPDFGLPFELYAPFLAAQLGCLRTQEQVDIANAAYNRWLADFCSTAPERFAGMATMSFHDVEAALREIAWAKEHGLRGLVLPMFTEEQPIFSPAFEPIWNLLEALEMPVNSHTAISGITAEVTTLPADLPHPACAGPLYGPRVFFNTHQLFSHLVWGGVLERHPDLQVVLTEQGTGWIVGELQALDYTWDGSYHRQDIREVVPRAPSEYFARQCHMGSSCFSLSEVQHRAEIGVDKMMLGMDYPHHEGAWGAGPGTLEYLRATLGAAGVSPEDARRVLGLNAVDLWHFDRHMLDPTTERVGLSLEAILTPPTEEHFPRGDVHKPMSVDVA